MGNSPVTARNPDGYRRAATARASAQGPSDRRVDGRSDMAQPPELDRIVDAQVKDPTIPTKPVLEVIEDDDGDPIIKTGPVTNVEPPWRILERNKEGRLL
jgi:hypothetical protein